MCTFSSILIVYFSGARLDCIVQYIVDIFLSYGATEFLKELCQALETWLACIVQFIYEYFRGERSAPLGMGRGESPAAEEPPFTVKVEGPLLMEVGEDHKRKGKEKLQLNIRGQQAQEGTRSKMTSGGPWSNLPLRTHTILLC